LSKISSSTFHAEVTNCNCVLDAKITWSKKKIIFVESKKKKKNSTRDWFEGLRATWHCILTNQIVLTLFQSRSSLTCKLKWTKKWNKNSIERRLCRFELDWRDRNCFNISVFLLKVNFLQVSCWTTFAVMMIHINIFFHFCGSKARILQKLTFFLQK
jgi:hypothetical protein